MTTAPSRCQRRGRSYPVAPTGRTKTASKWWLLQTFEGRIDQSHPHSSSPRALSASALPVYRNQSLRRKPRHHHEVIRTLSEVLLLAVVVTYLSMQTSCTSSLHFNSNARTCLPRNDHPPTHPPTSSSCDSAEDWNLPPTTHDDAEGVDHLRSFLRRRSSFVVRRSLFVVRCSNFCKLSNVQTFNRQRTAKPPTAISSARARERTKATLTLTLTLTLLL